MRIKKPSETSAKITFATRQLLAAVKKKKTPEQNLLLHFYKYSRTRGPLIQLALLNCLVKNAKSEQKSTQPCFAQVRT